MDYPANKQQTMPVIAAFLQLHNGEAHVLNLCL